jgi:hypothetical protein
MAEYIEREAVVHHFMNTRRYLTKDLVMDAAYEVSKMPAADVAPVVHGRWINHLGGWVNCSECKTVGSPQWKGCPVCLARMDGE